MHCAASVSELSMVYVWGTIHWMRWTMVDVVSLTIDHRIRCSYFLLWILPSMTLVNPPYRPVQLAIIAVFVCMTMTSEVWNISRYIQKNNDAFVVLRTWIMFPRHHFHSVDHGLHGGATFIQWHGISFTIPRGLYWYEPFLDLPSQSIGLWTMPVLR